MRTKIILSMALGIALGASVYAAYTLLSPGDKAITPLQAGDPWVAFNKELEKAAAYIHRDETPKDPLTVAEGYRFLARMLRLSWEHTYEYADPGQPKLFKINESYLTNGINTADCLYLTAIIDGNIDYKVSGLRGDAPLIEVSTYEGLLGTVKNSVSVSFLTEKDLQLEEDGSFSLILSSNQQPGNWLKTTPNTNVLFVRQYSHDWAQTRAAELKVEPLQPIAPRPTTLASVSAGYVSAAHFLNNYLEIYTGIANHDKDNILIPVPTTMQAALPGGHRYAAGSFKLQADEALVVSFKPVAAPYWGVQLGNYWSEVLDYESTGSHINNQTAVLEADGSIKLVVSHGPRPAGVVNWLDTRDHIVGSMVYRQVRNMESPPDFKIEHVKRQNLSSL